MIEKIQAKNIKLIAIDLDGTLLKADSSVSFRTKKAVEEAARAGYYIVPCTGRSYANTRYVLEGWKLSYFINANGSVLSDGETGKLLYMEAMDRQEVKAIYEIVKKHKVFLEIYGNQDAYVDEESHRILYQCGLRKTYCDQLAFTNLVIEDYGELLEQEGIKVGKIHILVPDIEERKTIMEEIAEIPGIFPISVIPENIEVINSTWSKWKGLLKLGDLLGISPESIMAIGDSNNDMEMLTHAGLSVAMGNAPDHVKAVCDLVTDTNQEDGVAKVLEELCRERNPVQG